MKDELTAAEKEAIAKEKTRIQNIYEERKQNCQSFSIKVPKNQCKYFIEPRGKPIQEIFQETGVSVEMPPPDFQSDIITLRGEQASDPKHHRYFVTRGTEVLKQISNDYGGVTVSIPKIGSNIGKVFLKWSKYFFKPAKQVFHEIVKDLEVMVTVECIIPQGHHFIVLGTRGSKVQTIQRQLNVTVKFPGHENPEDADKVMTNGDAHADVSPEDQPNPGWQSFVVPYRRSGPTSATCRHIWKQSVTRRETTTLTHD
ncbi:vigilin [Nephila pilipes]|uniref:Vigilin n=1 Tax=Nephila pilipes TaxID=299642 RepID=A0A8X6NB10_NEPPI|nr:vigilin [Nephila pilipes]